MRKQAKIRSFGSKWVKRSYAFGTEGIADGESDWLKVVYDFTGNPVCLIDTVCFADYQTEPQLPQGLSSPNFSHVLGTNTSAFELFVLKRKIMGPCWLRVKGAQVSISATVRPPPLYLASATQIVGPRSHGANLRSPLTILKT